MPPYINLYKVTQPKRIAIVGRVPLPYGGVSVHLERLLARLRSESIEYDFYDLGGKSDPERRVFPGKDCFLWLLWFLLRARRFYRLIHFHGSNPHMLLAADILMMGSRARLAYSLHGEGIFSWATKTGPWVLRWMLRRALRRADHLFSINPIVAQKLITDLGVNPNRISWMAAYLPPSEQELDPFNLTQEVCNFLEVHSPVIAMQAWFGSFQGGHDIYGLEHIVPFLQGLREKFPKVGLCTVISGTRCQQHRKHIYTLREEAGLESDWMLLEGDAPAVALFRQCDLFLRPTITDGDSLSIRECLSFSIPVVASDAVVRPEGCTLFPSEDAVGMTDAVAAVLETADTGMNNCLNLKDKDYAICLIDYYRNILDEFDQW